jgi:vWA-MoxR associated protein C-terminal domain
VFSAFVLWDDDDLKKLFVELKKENTIGIKLQKIPIQTGKGSVFAVILSTATPVALWLRCHLPECNQQVDGLLRCCIEQLTKTVAEKRREALPKPEDSHIGHHISLLWEDPYRLPPSIDYSM